jgi:hypothetical protein
MKNLILTLFLLVSTISYSQVYSYTKITDLNKTCDCAATIVLTDSTMSITHNDSTKTFDIASKTHDTQKGVHVVFVNDYKIKKVTICNTIAIITYNNPRKREVQFLNID